MSDSHSHEQDVTHTHHQASHADPQPDLQSNDELYASSPLSALSPSLLNDSRLATRGNAPARETLMRQAQKTHGNRAVQRAIHHSGSSASSPRPVQRAPFMPLSDEQLKVTKTPSPGGPVPIPYPNVSGGEG